MNIKVACCISLQLLFVMLKIVAGVITETKGNHVNHENGIGEKNQMDIDVSPIVLLLYTVKGKDLLAIYTDIETLKTTAFPKLSPLNYIELAAVALLCPASVEQENLKDVFLPLSITERIEKDKIYPTCQRNLKPVILENNDSGAYRIGYKVKNPDFFEIESNTPPNAMEEKLSEMISKSQYECDTWKHHQIHNVDLTYDFDLMTPMMSTHFLNAHMHSNDYTKRCDDFTLGLEAFEDKIAGFEVTIFSDFSVTHPDYILHQLIPMQDFKGKYATVSTCTYLNLTPLHKSVVEGPLRQLEILLRNIADTAGFLLITTGTHKEIPKDDEDTMSISTTDTGSPKEGSEVSRSEFDEETISIPKTGTETSERVSEAAKSDSDDETISIPTIFWKKISYYSADMTEFSILMVIHNEETTRICDTNETDEELGWPKSNSNETGIGTIYYCLVNETNVKKLGVKPTRLIDEGEVINPFNLNKMPFPSSINILEEIKVKKYGNTN